MADQGRGLSALPADKSVEARLNLLKRKRLAQIIIGPEIQSGNPLVDVAAGSQNQNGLFAAFLPPALQNFQPVFSRQSQIQNNGIIRRLQQRLFTVFAVLKPVNVEAELFQPGFNAGRGRSLEFVTAYFFKATLSTSISVLKKSLSISP